MTQQQLDDLFRANSERGEFAPQPGEWEAMTALIEEDERKDRYAQWVSIGWMSLFVLLILGGIYGLWASQQEDSDQPESAATITGPIADLEAEKATSTLSQLPTVAETTTGATEVDDHSFESTTGTLSQQNADTNAGGSNTSSQSSKVQLANRATTKASFEASNSKAIGSGVESPGNVTNASILSLTTQDALQGAEIESLVAGEDQVNPETNNQIEGATSSALNASVETQKQISSSLDALPLNELALLDNAPIAFAKTSPNVTVPSPAWTRFGLGLFVGEELTSVGMSSDVRFGTRVGAQLRYKPSSQWSIDLGANYSRKSYVATKGEMQNTMGLFFDGILPSQTDGESDVLEIPLTVTFLPKGHGKAGPFFSGGLISYRIFSEEMVFQYDQPTTQVTQVSAPDKGAIFGTAQLQAGYQFVPKRGPAWRFGPYLHVPISKVGSGDLPIYSVGLQLGVELF